MSFLDGGEARFDRVDLDVSFQGDFARIDLVRIHVRLNFNLLPSKFESLAYNDFGGDVLEGFEDEKGISLGLFVNLGHVHKKLEGRR